MGIGSVSSQGASQLASVKIGATATTSQGPFFIAEKEGFFARQGIRFEWVLSGAFGEASAPLLQEQIDAFSGGLSAAFFNAVAAAQRVRIVTSMGYLPPGDKSNAIVIRKDLETSVRRLADLRGRTIALNSLGGVSHYWLEKMLARDGVKVTEVQLVRIQFPSIVAALANRAVDAALLSEPWLLLVERQGSGVPLIYAGDVLPGEHASVLVYGPRFLDRDRALGQRFMVALLQGVAQFMRGPTDRNVSIIAEYLKADPAAVRESEWRTMYLDGRVNINSIRRFQDWLYSIGQIQVRTPADQLVDMSFAEQAARMLERR